VGVFSHALTFARALQAEGSVVANFEGIAQRAESSLQGSLLNQQLTAEELAGAQMPSGISGYAWHGLNQAISRDGVGVSVSLISDAVANPMSIYGSDPGAYTTGTFGYVGQTATVVLNSAGQIVTTWATCSDGFRLWF
jgi:hypothetical protein